MTASAYPLAWPDSWKRTPEGSRRPGHFGTRRSSVPGGYPMMRDITLAEAVTRTLDELTRMGVPRCDVIISTNVKLRRDGLPLSDQRAPADPGVAVYWRDGANSRCMAIDRYTKVEDNMAAIAATVEAMRAIERHGGATILDRAFSGFTALPAPGQTTARGWAEVMEFTAGECVTLEQAKDRYRRLSAIRHPDKGGTQAAMSELNWAWSQAQEAFRQ